MSVLNTIDDYDSFINSTDNEKDDINIIGIYSLLSIPASALLISLTNKIK